MEYPIIIIQLSDEDGGGYMGMVPDLVGCVSDGETRVEALENTVEAIDEWLITAKRRGLKIPSPGSAAARSKKNKDVLLKNLKEVTSSVDQIDVRLQELERVTKDLEEKLEHVSAWDKFADITGLELSEKPKRPHPAHC